MRGRRRQQKFFSQLLTAARAFDLRVCSPAPGGVASTPAAARPSAFAVGTCCCARCSPASVSPLGEGGEEGAAADGAPSPPRVAVPRRPFGGEPGWPEGLPLAEPPGPSSPDFSRQVINCLKVCCR